MLALLLRAGARRVALDTRDVVEVVPDVPLHPLPGAPAAVAGVLHHRAGRAAVIDLSALVDGAPAPPTLSTRLVLVRRDDGGLLALRAAQVTAVSRHHVGGAPLPGDGEAIPTPVRWTALVPPPLHGLTVPPA